MSTEIVSQPTPMMLLSKALDSGVDVEKLKSLFELQERWERNEAAKVFAEAVRKFQSKCPAIEKGNPVRGKKLSDGTPGPIHYKFASLEDIMEVAQPILDECEITPTFDTTFEGKLMRTTCHVRVGIHVEDTSVTLGIPVIPNANDAQMAGGCLKYGMRYALVAALNIRIKGEDTDGAGLGSSERRISEEEEKLLMASITELTMLRGKAVDIKALMRFASPDLKSLSDMNVEQYTRVMSDMVLQRQDLYKAEKGKK